MRYELQSAVATASRPFLTCSVYAELLLLSRSLTVHWLHCDRRIHTCITCGFKTREILERNSLLWQQDVLIHAVNKTVVVSL